MTWGYAHNADHSPTLNLPHSHYTVIIHNLVRGITLINRAEVIQETGREREVLLTTQKHVQYSYIYNPVFTVAHFVVLFYVTSNG